MNNENTQVRPLPGKKLNCKECEKTTYVKLTAKQVLEIIDKKCAPTVKTEFKKGTGVHTVIILPEAKEYLESVIGYGKRKPRPYNYYEQMFHGIGHIFGDENGYTVVISHFIYINAYNRSRTGAKIIDGENDGIFQRLEYERNVIRENEITCNVDENGYIIDPFVTYGGSMLVLLGHTHPNGLDCFFSGPDRISSIDTPDFPAATFVCNPMKENMLAMVGGDENTRVILCSKKKISEKRDKVVSLPEFSKKDIKTSIYDKYEDLDKNADKSVRRESVEGTEKESGKERIDYLLEALLANDNISINEAAEICSYIVSKIKDTGECKTCTQNEKSDFRIKKSFTGTTLFDFSMSVKAEKKHGWKNS